MTIDPTALITAIRAENSDQIRAIFAQDSSGINETIASRHLHTTPLAHAVHYHKPAAVKTLLELGAMPDEKTSDMLVDALFAPQKKKDATQYSAQTIFRLIADAYRRDGHGGYNGNWAYVVKRATDGFIEHDTLRYALHFVTHHMDIPQYDVHEQFGTQSLSHIALKFKHKIGELAQAGIDFSPLVLGHASAWCNSELLCSIEHILQPTLNESRQQVDAWFNKGNIPMYTDCFGATGYMRPALRQALSMGQARNLFAAQRWQGHSTERLTLTEAVRGSLSPWSREQFDRQVDLLEIRREASAAELSVSSLAGRRKELAR